MIVPKVDLYFTNHMNTYTEFLMHCACTLTKQHVKVSGSVFTLRSHEAYPGGHFHSLNDQTIPTGTHKLTLLILSYA